ncbi:hypothetical protein [Christensenella intestinihominis]|uniref:hypothetical protein n=2 Tax=Christensenella intestinihominis TaxID=1851429 RepID=UPI0011C709F2|nr:hypothetical protein [Christensenella intestinihominis]
MDNMENSISANRIIVAALAVLILIPLVFAAADSIVMTADIPDPSTEATAFLADLPWIHLAAAAVVAALLAALREQLCKLPEKRLLVVGMALVFAAGLAWVFTMRVEPGADQYFVLKGAGEILQGDYRALMPGGYFYTFPHQLGLALYFQPFILIAGQNAWLWLQAANVLWLLLGFYCLYRITMLLFGKREVTNITLLLMLLCFEILLYVVFVYGNIPAFGLGLLAVLCQVRYFKSRKKRFAVLSAAAAVAGILLRNNNLVWLAAMLLFYLLDCIFERKPLSVVFAALLAGVSLAAGGAVNLYYSGTTGLAVNDGVPRAAWVAMGMQEGPMAPGWYNAYSRTVYEETGYDGAQTALLAREDAEQSLQNFAQQPGYAAQFFYRKVSSTWNNPTFQGFWISQVRDYSAIGQGKLSNSIYYGRAHLFLKGFMNIYQSLIYVGAAAFFLLRFKKIKREQLLPGVIFLGTFLFHIFWETKAQYAATCFPLLIPYAACGWLEISGRLREWLAKKPKKKKNFHKKPEEAWRDT